MRFKTDENLPEEVAGMLEEAGHGASTVLEESMGSESDPNVMSACLREGRALITLDLGFADIRTYPPGDAPAARLYDERGRMSGECETLQPDLTSPATTHPRGRGGRPLSGRLPVAS